MNSTWQVARTYLWRPRFWVLGAIYLLFVYLALATDETPVRGSIAVSVVMACLFVCFVALHLRRQFGDETVRLTPRYPLPHLAVGLLAGGLFWAIVPGVLVLAGRWPPGALAIHALPGILAGLVAVLPQAIMLLVTLPFLVTWINYLGPYPGKFLPRLIDGREPAAAAALVVAALAANALAALVLLRLPGRGVSTNDEIALDAPVPSEHTFPWSRWTLAMRDAAADRLSHACVFPSVARWRVPVAISRLQLAWPLALLLAMCAVGWFFGAVGEFAVTSTIVSSGLLLVVPYGPWHLRRRSFALELMRPVSRAAFFRQIALALAWDVCVWVAVASLLSVAVFLTLARFAPGDVRLHFFIAYYSVLWSMALFLYGLAVATMRLRLWLLVVAIGGMAWLIGVWLLVITIALEFRHQPSTPATVYACSLVSAVTGLSLAWITFRRWHDLDVA